MKINQIYKYSYNYLIKRAKGIVSKSQIDSFISTVDAPNFNSLEDAYDMLLLMLQNFQRFPNVIKYQEREKYIKKQIGFPDLTICSKKDPLNLAKSFMEKYKSESKICWERYCKGIVSGAKFLASFKDYDDFKKTCDSFDQNNMTREAFALFLQTKIDNMGFAIACDWLKELGYVNYPKPDVHMKDICFAFGLIDEKKRDIDCFEAVVKVANSCRVDPYKLDKVWWLICSGNFYRYNKKIPNPQKTKADFIERIRLEK